MVSEGGRHALIIPKLILEHSGTYVCRAINSYGVVESSAKLKVFIRKSTSQPDSIIKVKQPPSNDQQSSQDDANKTSTSNDTNGSLNI